MVLHLTEKQIDLITESIRFYKEFHISSKHPTNFRNELQELENELYQQDPRKAGMTLEKLNGN